MPKKDLVGLFSILFCCLISVIYVSFSIATTSESIANVQFNISGPGEGYTFYSVLSGNANISISYNANTAGYTTTSKDTLLDNTTIEIHFKANDTETITCYYDIYWVWDNPGSGISPYCNGGCSDGTYGSSIGYGTTDNTVKDLWLGKNFQYYGTYWDLDTCTYNENYGSTACLIANYLILNNSKTTETIHTYNFTMYWRNLPYDQSVHVGKKYRGHYKVELGSCS